MTFRGFQIMRAMLVAQIGCMFMICLADADDRICYYPCDEAVDGRALDASGSGVDAVYVGPATTDACDQKADLIIPGTKARYSGIFPSLVDEGLFNKALRCYGGGRQDIRRKGLNLGKGDFTISFWVNHTGFNQASDFGGGGGRGCIVSGSSPRLYIYLDDSGKMTLEMPDAGKAAMSSTDAPAKNQWAHVAFVVDRDNHAGCKIYMNGVAEKMTSVRMAGSEKYDYNISSVFSFGQALIGDIDDIAVYGKALSAPEIKSIYSKAPRELLAPVEVSVAQKTPPLEQSKAHKPYRFIYNLDSSGVIYGYNSLVAKNVKEYLRSNADFLEGTHVDAVFWHDGAGGNTANWDSDVMELTGARVGKVDPFLLELIKGGNDPARIVIPEIQKHGVDVFYSFRVNDCHDNLGNHPELVATFKDQHPEWTIGSGHPYGGPRQLNFAIPEVRDLKFAVIEEVFRKYNFDGLELDLLRSPPYFIPGEEPENAHLLTEYLRRVRKHLNKRSAELRRKLMLAVRVDENMEACRLDGFDVTAWVKEGLVDIISMGSGAKDIAVEEFKALTKGTDVKIYPCLYTARHPRAEEVYRALATNYRYQGADGIYTFNWGAHSSHMHKTGVLQRKMLSQVDDLKAMSGKDTLFLADSGKSSTWYPHNWIQAPLPMMVEAGEQADVPVMIGQDFTKISKLRQIVMILRYEVMSDTDDDMRLQLNKMPLPKPKRESGMSVQLKLKPEQLKPGRNYFTVSALRSKLKVTAVEIYVDYIER